MGGMIILVCRRYGPRDIFCEQITNEIRRVIVR